MTQESRPQSGEAPTDGEDCGAYTGKDWTSLSISRNRAGGVVHTLTGTIVSAYPNVGVFYAMGNRLAVTSPGASQISIDTGVALVDGRDSINDTAIVATAITNPGGNPRIDRVVVRQNYGLIDYTSVNAPALIVPFNTARIAIVSGAEAGVPVAPPLVQDTASTPTTYWDTPLAQYQISVAGAITNLTDEREWVDAETKYLYVDPNGGWSITDGTIISQEATRGLLFPDAKRSQGYGAFVVPSDYITSMIVSGIVNPLATGNIYALNSTAYGACGENHTTHSNSIGYTATAVTVNLNNCDHALTLTSANVADIVNMTYDRDATNVLDTIGAGVRFNGWIVQYLGWGRR